MQPGQTPRSRESASLVSHHKVRFERGESGVAVVAQGGNGFAEFSVASASGHHRACGGDGVLHLQIRKMGAQHGVALGEGTPHAHLHEVRAVPRHPKVHGSNRFDNVEHPLRGVAVDFLLVFVEQDDIVLLGQGGKRTHALKHRIPDIFGGLVL